VKSSALWIVFWGLEVRLFQEEQKNPYLSAEGAAGGIHMPGAGFHFKSFMEEVGHYGYCVPIYC
jgi:hypothetical protein